MLPDWHPAKRIVGAIEDDLFAAALNAAWKFGEDPGFLIARPAIAAGMREFAEHGHMRKTIATVKGMQEAERLLGIQYRRRK